MIDPKELRIGNLLHWEADHICGGICTVIDISCFDYEIQSLGGCFPSEEEKKTDVIPIPLTPEWLERMGFEKKLFTYPGDPKTESVEAFVKGRFVIRWIDIGTHACYKGEWFPYAQSQNSLPCDLIYVHQLQNNYYWWTDGEEIKIKELA